MADDEFLSLEKEFLLDINCGKLIKRIDSENTILLDLLKDKGVLDPTQKESFQLIPEKKHRNKNILEILRTRSNSDFDEFCDALRETSHGRLVDHFLSNAAIERKIKLLQGHLASHFRNTYNDEMFTYHCEGYRLSLEGLYQSLQWVEHEKSAAGIVSKPLDSYFDLFKEMEPTGRFIVTAESNGGKTTMLRKICRDWADPHLGGQNKGNLWQFDIMIPIVLRAVRKDASLKETIKQQLGITGDDAKTLLYCLKSDKMKKCFVFDGLDEYNARISREVTDVMGGNLYQSSWCIITSRPEGTSRLNDWSTILYRKAELKGFSEENIKKYVQYFFSKKDPELGNCLLQKIFPKEPLCKDVWSDLLEDENEGIVELVSNPGRLALTCMIYSVNKTLPLTREQLTQEFVRFMLCRWQQKYGPEQSQTQSRDDILDKNKNILLVFGKLARKKN